ncbi:FtsX-like permease family protein [Paenibacillus sp. NPDC057967]|uniref:ABC transporter permease n=1 Tax=Paenibacillus sp. NPDC057967 TaxID=3346293 RepID=UPI0036DA7F8E
MLIQMLRRDVRRKKSISIALFIFISISALLVASGSNMLMELTQSLNALFKQSKAPHFVQMHAGSLDEAEVHRFATAHELVEEHQIAAMVNVDGSHLYIDHDGGSEEQSVMDHYFVKQNESFDLLLNVNNEPIQVAKGEIAVPVYYKQHKDVNIGDKIKLTDGGYAAEWTVAGFVRDAQMNASIVHSKRFVVHPSDWEALRQRTGEMEYLIEFRLKDQGMLQQFRNDYQAALMPSKGPSVDYSLFKTLNALTDGILAAVIILVSLLLSLVAILCLRYTLLAAMEEDYREIGIMKAIGIRSRAIKNMYMLKYTAMAVLASIVGYVASWGVNALFTSNIALYLGSAPKSLLLYAVPLAAAALICAIVIGCCKLTLRSFDRISAVEALRAGTLGETRHHRKAPVLHRNRWLSVPIFLGMRDVLSRFKMYRLLLAVFIISTCIMIIPANLLNTFKSPSFNTYMGIERSDLRIDMQYSDGIAEAFGRVSNALKEDADVARFSPIFVSAFHYVNSDGVLEEMTVETGDFSIFPLEYAQGAAPVRENEIALSYLNGKDLGKKVGDRIPLFVDGIEREMTVSGIYQDVTNGGRTAKAALPFLPKDVIRYEVSVDLKEGVPVSDKQEQYAKSFYPAKVTDLAGYLSQTLGNTIDQLRLLTVVAVVIAVLIAILITALFLHMAVAKDAAQIAIMRSIGFSLPAIRIQYLTRALLVLGIGIVLGTIVSNTAGQSLASLILSFMGASSIQFVIHPVQAYAGFPIILMSAVMVTTLLSIASIKKTNITEWNAG